MPLFLVMRGVLLLVDDLNHLAVSLERHGFYVSFFLPEEKSSLAGDAGLIGHLAFQVTNVDAADFV